MNRMLPLLILVVLGAAAPAQGAEAPAAEAIKVSGAISTPSNYTVDQLKTEFASEVKPIEFSSHGAKHTANCLSLLTLLTHCGVPLEMKTAPNADPKTKNRPLRLAVVVRASDGYAATFSLAELMPDYGNREVWLAMDTDGKPLLARDGPLRLIVPSDTKPGRRVHGITNIVVVDAATASEAKP